MTSPLDAVPVAVRSLAELFRDALPDVKFPYSADASAALVDAATLEGAVVRVDEQSAEVARLEDELARARAALETSRDELVRLAARAHAYARVYAEDDDALRARVDGIALPRARSRGNGANAAGASSTSNTPSATLATASGSASGSASTSSSSSTSVTGASSEGEGRKRKRRAAEADASSLFDGSDAPKSDEAAA